ncbi:MAG: HAD-IIB family hydrolase [Pseudomonadota bacterium]
MNGSLRLVFTDLDGSLLDHDSYSYREALPQLHTLQRRAVPVIPVSSKTASEIGVLRRELDNGHPFIAENGAAVYVPEGYFEEAPTGVTARDGYWLYELSARRETWLAVLDDLRKEFEGEFENFFEVGVDGIARMTNLSPQAAALANAREYSEPVKWCGSEQRRNEFVDALRDKGASVLQGGRFLSVSGDCDKGRALCWLRSIFMEQSRYSTCDDLAIGDSGNDIAMLEAAGTALLVRSPAHGFPTLNRVDKVIHSHHYGPAGWAEGVEVWLASSQVLEKGAEI